MKRDDHFLHCEVALELAVGDHNKLNDLSDIPSVIGDQNKANVLKSQDIRIEKETCLKSWGMKKARYIVACHHNGKPWCIFSGIDNVCIAGMAGLQ